MRQLALEEKLNFLYFYKFRKCTGHTGHIFPANLLYLPHELLLYLSFDTAGTFQNKTLM